MISSVQCGKSAGKFSSDQTHDKEAQDYRADQGHADNRSPSPKLIHHTGLPLLVDLDTHAQCKDLPISPSHWIVAPIDF